MYLASSEGKTRAKRIHVLIEFIQKSVGVLVTEPCQICIDHN